jgi:polysaccharide biosynthesis/export protein
MKPAESAMSRHSLRSLSPRRWPLLATLLLLSACYQPGRFTWVDDYRESQVQADENYTIRKGDLLSVNVWNQAGISSRIRVRDDGRISLPLINDVEALGQTPPALARLLEQRLKDLVANPVVTVMVDEAQPIKVSMLGEVRGPGLELLEAGSGLLQALSAAGGFTDYAREDAIYVLRKQPGYDAPVRIRFTYEALTRSEGSASSFRLKTGDVVVVE